MKSIRTILKNPTVYIYLLIFTIIFLLTKNMHYNADEFNYSHIPWTTTKIQSFGDILYSQKLLYKMWTGRILVHSLIQTFLFIGYKFYAIANSLIFCIFLYLISKLISVKKTPYIILLLFSIIWLFSPAFGETVIWLSGSLNYLWPSTLFVLLLNLYSKDNSNTALLMIIALFSGASHEMVVICGGAYFLLDICIGNFNRKKGLVFLCFIAGGLLLVLAPGNFLRASQSFHLLRKFNIIKILTGIMLFVAIIFINTILKSKFIKYINKLRKKQILTIISIVCFLLFTFLLVLNLINYYPYNHFRLAKMYCFRFIIISASITILLVVQCIKQNIPTEKLIPNLNLFFIGVISSLAMNVMPECPDRSFFLSCTFISISVASLLSYLEFRKSYLISSIIFTLSSITVVLTLHFYIISLGSWKNDFNTQLKANEGLSQAILPIQPTPSRLINNYYGAAPSQLTNNPNSIANVYAARYYNFEEIVGIKKNTVVMKITKDNLNTSNISFEYTDSDGNKKKSYPDENLIASADKNKNVAFITIPSDASDIKLINNTNLDINSNDITTIKLQ